MKSDITLIVPAPSGLDRNCLLRFVSCFLYSFAALLISPELRADDAEGMKAFTIPLVDLADQTDRQVLVDREEGQYLGHPTTVLLDDGKTILCVYPKGHGKGAIVYKRSDDGGLTWSERLPVPESWATSREVPTLYRTIGPDGKKRLHHVFRPVSYSHGGLGRRPACRGRSLNRSATSAGIVAMGSVVPLKTGAGHYMAFFHDDGRFITAENTQKSPPEMKLYTTKSTDGGLTWSAPRTVFGSSEILLCEPGVIRSPDGKTLAMLLRENARRKNSHIIFSDDEGETWTEPREMPASLCGDRHTGKYLPDGRLFISFRDYSPRSTPASPTEGDWVGWLGTWDDLVEGREGAISYPTDG